MDNNNKSFLGTLYKFLIRLPIPTKLPALHTHSQNYSSHIPLDEFGTLALKTLSI